ncbi:MAG: ribonuclease III [Planctomycetota bacterium]
MTTDTTLLSCVTDTSFLRLQDHIGYLFQNPSLLERALTHPSSTTEDNQDNERMEFLGDSVVNLFVAQELYEQHADWSEGDLTQVKSEVVNTTSLAHAAESLKLREVARFGKGLSLNDPLPPSVYANLFEAVTAAIYLDGGPAAARSFVLRILGSEMRVLAENGGELNPKSKLQHITQKKYNIQPYYRLVSVDGPDHNKVFNICACVGQQVFPPGTGRNKKEAEQAAARLALDAIQAQGLLAAAALENDNSTSNNKSG